MFVLFRLSNNLVGLPEDLPSPADVKSTRQVSQRDQEAPVQFLWQRLQWHIWPQAARAHTHRWVALHLEHTRSKQTARGKGFNAFSLTPPHTHTHHTVQECGPTSARCARRPLRSAAPWSPTWRRSTASRSRTPTRSGATSCTCARSAATRRERRTSCTSTTSCSTQTATCSRARLPGEHQAPGRQRPLTHPVRVRPKVATATTPLGLQRRKGGLTGSSGGDEVGGRWWEAVMKDRCLK